MLGREHAGGECLDVILAKDRHRRLRNDRAGIGFRDDEVHGGAGDARVGDRVRVNRDEEVGPVPFRHRRPFGQLGVTVGGAGHEDQER